MDRLHLHSSVSTLAEPTFINVEPINEMISKCEIKVMYTGFNRNGTFISREAIEKMSRTLPGSPIIGRFHEDRKDFGDHETGIGFDSNGDLITTHDTMPYGFVGTDARVWFQTYIDTDLKGVSVEREYLMTEGYLWTGRFPELFKVMELGANQSMELGQIEGEWAEDPHTRCNFFIVDDGVFTGLCLLGDDVEPCMEGASVTSFSLEKDNTTLMKEVHEMLKEISFAIKDNKKEETMDLNNPQLDGELNASVEPAEEGIENQAPAAAETGEQSGEVFAKEDEDKKDEKEAKSEDDKDKKKDEDDKEDFSKKDEDEDDKKDQSDSKKKEDNKDDEDEDDDKKKPFQLQEQLDTLQAMFDTLQTEKDALKAEFEAYRSSVERVEKEALVKTFSDLSEEEVSDVVGNIDTYSLEEIESKLSVIAFRKINAQKQEEASTAAAEEEALTFSLDNKAKSSKPEWIQAIINSRDN